MLPILRYINRSHRKEGESPLSGSIEGKPVEKDDGANLNILKKKYHVASTKCAQAKGSRPSPQNLIKRR